MRGMLVCCCGAREWTDVEAIYKRLERLPLGTKIVTQGHPKGADLMIKQAVSEMPEYRFVFEEVQALGRNGRDWTSNLAGPIRNVEIIKMKPDLVIAFHNRLDYESKKTKNLVDRARKSGIPVEVVTGRDRRENEYQTYG